MAQSMLVAVCPIDRPALDGAFYARTVHPASKGQHGVGLGPEEDVLLIDGAFQFALLTRTLVMTDDHATLLGKLHDLGAFPSIGPSRVDCPIALDVRWGLLRARDTAENKDQKREAEK